MTGQQDINSDFGYETHYTSSDSFAQYPFGDTYYGTMRPSAYNPDLKWETTTTYNAGLDLGFLNNRISANIDGYYRETKDLLNYSCRNAVWFSIDKEYRFAEELWCGILY